MNDDNLARLAAADSNIVVWHDETHLSIGVGEHGPIPPALRDRLIGVMSYTHVSDARGSGRRDPLTGDFRKRIFTPVDMYAFEPDGRLACPSGFLRRVLDEAAALGLSVDVRHVKFDGYMDSRPNAWRTDWQRLFRFFTPRYRQDEMLAAIASNVYGRFDVGTGVGKTYCSGAVGLLFPDAEIALVVPTAGVFQTAYSHFLELLPVDEVGRWGHGKKDRKRVTIYSLQSLPGVAAAARPDIVLVDECHMAVTDRAVDSVQTLSRRARLFGFSATMHKRYDGHHHRLEAVFGPVVFKLGAVEAVERGLTVPVRVVWHDVDLPWDPARSIRDPTAIKRWSIWRNAVRNDRIADVARRYGSDEQVLILVETTEHALQLASRLPDYLVCVNNVSERLERGFLDSGVVDPSRVRNGRKERTAVIDGFKAGSVKKLIGNDTLGIGFSPEQLKVIIRGDARQSSVKSVQSTGRGNRLHVESGKSLVVVHDFNDKFSDVFSRYAGDRKLDYAREGYAQVRDSDGSEIKVKVAPRG